MKKIGKRTLPRLSRGGKIVRNMFLAALLLYSVWAAYGFCPMPTEEMAFRRIERQNLLGPTEIILHIPDEDVYVSGEVDGVYRTRRIDQTEAQFVGLGDGYAVAAAVHPFSNSGTWIKYWPLDEQKGIKLIPLVDMFTDWRGGEERLRDNWDHTYNCGIVVPELPVGAAKAEMYIWEGEEKYHDWGTWEAPGCWLFGFQRRADSVGSDWLHGLPYELIVYNENGDVLARQAGNVPGK